MRGREVFHFRWWTSGTKKIALERETLGGDRAPSWRGTNTECFAPEGTYVKVNQLPPKVELSRSTFEPYSNVTLLVKAIFDKPLVSLPIPQFASVAYAPVP
jgi:hypothetical protein